MSENDTLAVTTWWLEQTAPEDLRVARLPRPESGVRVERAEVPSPEFSRFLYASVGQDVTWTDRLPWTYDRWRKYLDRPGVETWVAYEFGTPAGFIELNAADAQDRGGEESVEISYFGLLPAFRGRGIGGHLLSYGTARAWDLAARWPQRPGTKRVWLHTCTKDGQHARANYERRGFTVYRDELTEERAVPTPGPWPNAT